MDKIHSHTSELEFLIPDWGAMAIFLDTSKGCGYLLKSPVRVVKANPALFANGT